MAGCRRAGHCRCRSQRGHGETEVADAADAAGHCRCRSQRRHGGRCSQCRRRAGRCRCRESAPTRRPISPTAPPAVPEHEPETARVPEGPEPTTMEELLREQSGEIRSLKHGDVVEGTVVRIDKDEILVDIGAKSEGVVSNRELYGRHAESSSPSSASVTWSSCTSSSPSRRRASRPLAPPRRPRAQVALDAGAFDAGDDHRARSSTTTRAA